MRTLILTLLCCLGLMACKSGKPSEKQCKKAVDNIRKVTGLDKADLGARPETMVRSCRANATKADADCMIAAKSVEDLEKCEGETGAEFYKDEEERENKEREEREKKKAAEKAKGGDDE